MSDGAAALMGDNGAASDAGTDDDLNNGAGVGDSGNNGSSGSGEPSWTDTFGEDDRAIISTKGWGGPADMLQSYKSLEKFAGGSKSLVELPGADPTEDQLNEFYGKLGRPDTADDYGFAKAEGADDNVDKWFRQTSHKLGLTESQAAALYSEYDQMAAGRAEELAAQAESDSVADVQNLEKEWGKDYQKNIDQGQIAVRNLGFEAEELETLEAKLGTAGLLRLFSKVGSGMGEDSFVSGERGGSFGTTGAEARNEIETLKSDSAFMDKYLAGDKSAVARMTRLTEKAYG